MFHCGQCGTKFKSVSFPKECRECSHIQYSNPNPVAVALIPVWKSDTTATLGVRLGIILGKRGIYPMLGEWALPGGYVENDLKETAEMAAVREVREEIGLSLDESKMQTTHTDVSGRGSLLVFCDYKLALAENDALVDIVATDECPEVRIAWEPEELCFPTHTRALYKWFKDRGLLTQ